MSSSQQLGTHQAEGIQQTQVAFIPRREVTLHLRPAPSSASRDRHISWEANVKDNQNQRVSKSCCIFHKKKLFGESSSDDDSTSSSCSDQDDSCHGCANNNEAKQNGEACGDGEGGAGAQGSCGSRRKKRPPCTREHCYCGTRFH
ncbi:protein phosphatase inhibitor, putative [Trypanosoma equiperdum]|uniref:Protein phosphatase inhibitor n=2 Tax=Trypanozoon TaxID=39700 RepID=Q57VQ0_TRYB2|nr:hypothetical protein, conserved [Trypanosoma brucei brucei TREU927]AAX70346.1 hypothetical protein, conserved [Trypanosoma brucei]AAZ12875.1 hypothetical protein, conserved [Trypanosoma brucei brucei TREU927]SCU68954.1 protein phosphatase inhibitor, putative [Trypanosoma equiperdum]